MAGALKYLTVPLRRAVRTSCSRVARFYSASSQADVRKTALYDFHVDHGGKMVPFAGWSMPLQYSDLSVVQSSKHTRTAASLFDVSHMLQIEVRGQDSEGFLEHLLVGDMMNLPIRSSMLSLFTNSCGGIIDDCIVTRTGPKSFFIVANAANADKDLTHMKTQLKDHSEYADVNITVLEDRSLLALQGPCVADVLSQSVSGDFAELYFMHSSVMDVCGIPDCRVSRCGYTGEDGVEISVSSDKAVDLAKQLLCHSKVKLAGLAARDILRIEAGLCLYGNDMTEETTPIEAGLLWCIGKRRRSNGGFLGSEVILQQLKVPPKRKRVGLVSHGPPQRSNMAVLDSDGEEIGVVTSAAYSPNLGYNVGMAFVPRKTKLGSEVELKIRNKTITAKVVKMPFIPACYHKSN